jgi:hypothetical protein
MPSLEERVLDITGPECDTLTAEGMVRLVNRVIARVVSGVGTGGPLVGPIGPLVVEYEACNLLPVPAYRDLRLFLRGEGFDCSVSTLAHPRLLCHWGGYR